MNSYSGEVMYVSRQQRSLDQYLVEIGQIALVSPDEAFLVDSVNIDIERALSRLNPREAEITRLYFGLGYTYSLPVSTSRL